MTSRYRTTRHRRPLSTGEVALFASLVVLVFGFGVYRPGQHANAAPRHNGMALMNVRTADAVSDALSPADLQQSNTLPVTDATTPATTATLADELLVV